MRKHLAWYLKGLPGAARVRERIMELTTREAIAAELQAYVRQLGEGAADGAGEPADEGAELTIAGA